MDGYPTEVRVSRKGYKLKGRYVDPIERFSNRNSVLYYGDRCVEIKWSDQEAKDQFLLTTDTRIVPVLPLISLGYGPSERVGSLLRYMAVLVKCGIEVNVNPLLNAVAAQDWFVARMALVWDRRPDRTRLTVYSDVFQDVDVNGATYSTATSGLNLSNKDRFMVIRDCIFMTPTFNFVRDPFGNDVLCVQSAPSQDEKCFYKEWYVPMHGFESVYDGTSNDPLSYTGEMLFISISTDPDPAFGHWFLDYTIRVRYI